MSVDVFDETPESPQTQALAEPAIVLRGPVIIELDTRIQVRCEVAIDAEAVFRGNALDEEGRREAAYSLDGRLVIIERRAQLLFIAERHFVRIGRIADDGFHHQIVST